MQFHSKNASQSVQTVESDGQFPACGGDFSGLLGDCWWKLDTINIYKVEGEGQDGQISAAGVEEHGVVWRTQWVCLQGEESDRWLHKHIHKFLEPKIGVDKARESPHPDPEQPALGNLLPDPDAQQPAHGDQTSGSKVPLNDHNSEILIRHLCRVVEKLADVVQYYVCGL